MARYKMSDGTIVDTAKASKSWEENTRFDGHNNVSVHTGSQWTHETLYRSRKGRYYIEVTSQWQGSAPHAEWISNEEATRWLLLDDSLRFFKHGLPEELEQYEEAVSE